MAVGVRHQFVGFFARGIQAERMVHIVVHRERHGGVSAINARAAGIHKVFNTMMAATFKNMGKTHDIAVDIGEWVVKRVAHTCLGRQVNHALGFVTGEGRLHRLTVGKVDAQMGIVWMCRVAGQARLFKRGIVVVVVVIYTNYCIATFQEP